MVDAGLTILLGVVVGVRLGITVIVGESWIGVGVGVLLTTGVKVGKGSNLCTGVGVFSTD